MNHPSFRVVRLGSALALFGIAATISLQALAQVPAQFVGSWKATWQTDKKHYEATMSVTEQGGVWQTYVSNQNNPCAGREVAMKLESATPAEVKFILQFSQIIPGCSNASVTLKAAPDGTITGTRSKFDLKLVRQ